MRSRSSVENANVIGSVNKSDSLCRVFQAPATGWYALVLVWAVPWTPPPTPNSGIGAFLQRYDPAQGDSLTDCPAPNVG